MTANETAKMTIAISPEQVDQLALACQWAKTLGSPARLAILGVLGARLGHVVTVEELAGAIAMAHVPLDREIGILADAGLLQIEAWAPGVLGGEPQPARVLMTRDYLKTAGQVTAVLHQLLSQVRPPAARPAGDERAQVLGRLMSHGRLLAWPEQYKRQVWVIEEVAKSFVTGRTYGEREVDAILKEIFAYDHCTLRRSLVDLKLLQRENGIYWKPEPPLQEENHD